MTGATSAAASRTVKPANTANRHRNCHTGLPRNANRAARTPAARTTPSGTKPFTACGGRWLRSGNIHGSAKFQ